MTASVDLVVQSRDQIDRCGAAQVFVLVRQGLARNQLGAQVVEAGEGEIWHRRKDALAGGVEFLRQVGDD